MIRQVTSSLYKSAARKENWVKFDRWGKLFVFMLIGLRASLGLIEMMLLLLLLLSSSSLLLLSLPLSTTTTTTTSSAAAAFGVSNVAFAQS